jgi:nucleotide-binding universal stress UspA family protein
VTEQILICYDGSEDAERAVGTAAALLGPREAVVLTVAPAMTELDAAAIVIGSRGLGGLREFARGSV